MRFWFRRRRPIVIGTVDSIDNSDGLVVRATLIHGDVGHSCYDDDGQLSCVIGKMLLSNGPDWRTLAGVYVPPALSFGFIP